MAAPVVTNVTATNTNGTYRAGTVITATVTFDQVVNVTGTPQLLLNFEPTNRQANYASGTGTATISLTYTLVAGDAALDLDYNAVGSLTLNGGTVQNAGLENATLTLPAPGAAGSISANKQINCGTVYVVAFKNAGVPATALTPTITTPVTAGDAVAYAGATAVAELAGGSYKFAADPQVPVFLGVDGGAALANADRYVQMIIGPQDAYLDGPVTTGSLDLASGIETGVTQRQALRAIAAMLAGNASGGPAGSVFRALANASTTRVTAVATAVGDRTMTPNLG